jgi:hypothetical protein
VLADGEEVSLGQLTDFQREGDKRNANSPDLVRNMKVIRVPSRQRPPLILTLLMFMLLTDISLQVWRVRPS